MNTKHCTGCSETKPHAAFHVDNSNADGRHQLCKTCRTVSGVRYDGRERKANRDFSRLMARIPAFNTGALTWAV